MNGAPAIFKNLTNFAVPKTCQPYSLLIDFIRFYSSLNPLAVLRSSVRSRSAPPSFLAKPQGKPWGFVRCGGASSLECTPESRRMGGQGGVGQKMSRLNKRQFKFLQLTLNCLTGVQILCRQSQDSRFRQHETQATDVR